MRFNKYIYITIAQQYTPITVTTAHRLRLTPVRRTPARL